MRRYSAGEAIGPAWEHTKALLWRERKWGRLLKLSLVAIGAEMGSGLNFNGGSLGRHTDSHKFVSEFAVALIVVLALIGLAVYIALLYLGSRLQLAQFDILVLRDPYVAPAWSRHGHHTWRWAGLRFVITLGSFLLLAPLLVPAIPLFVALGHAMTDAQAQLHWPAILELVAVVVIFLFLFLVIARFATSVVLPGVAMEDLRFGPALRRGWDLFRSDVPGMLLLTVLQPLFQIMLSIATIIGMVVVLAITALPFVLMGALLWAALHKAGTASWIVLGIFGALSGFVVLVAWLLLYLAVSGTLLTFARTWSLYFLGGRYALLGQYLEPGPAVPVWTPPPSLSEDDDDSGPDFPADPALA